MPGVEFYQTAMGHRFYTATMPELVDTIKAHTKALDRLTAAIEANTRVVQNLQKSKIEENLEERQNDQI